MVQKLSSRPIVLVLIVMALLAVSLPVLAQDGGSDWLTTSDRGMVGISAPAAGAALSGSVDIEGTAQSNNFNYYKVEYSIDEGANWLVLAEEYKMKTQVADGVLDTWDTTMVDNGAYWLRAVVVDNTGNFVASNPVAVTVANDGAADAVADDVADAVADDMADDVADDMADDAAAAPAGWLTTSDRGMVGISAPAAGAALSGSVDIEGTAQSNNFNYYKVEYSIDEGANWLVLAEEYKMKTQVADGVLDTWDTTMVDNGAYWLRAVVVDNTGNFVASNPVAVTVANDGAADAVADDGDDIVDVAVGAGSFTKLVAAVQAAGLVDALKGPGPFTVFAPTDAAFEALPDEIGRASWRERV